MFFAGQNTIAQKSENPITVSYLQNNLSKKSPKLILTPEIEKELRKKIKTDPTVKTYYQYLQKEASLILDEPLLKRELEGFRLLAVSREMVEVLLKISGLQTHTLPVGFL